MNYCHVFIVPLQQNIKRTNDINICLFYIEIILKAELKIDSLQLSKSQTK